MGSRFLILLINLSCKNCVLKTLVILLAFFIMRMPIIGLIGNKSHRIIVRKAWISFVFILNECIDSKNALEQIAPFTSIIMLLNNLAYYTILLGNF